LTALETVQVAHTAMLTRQTEQFGELTDYRVRDESRKEVNAARSERRRNFRLWAMGTMAMLASSGVGGLMEHIIH
jgi:hypothetical protein